jgi:hypothetical protein
MNTNFLEKEDLLVFAEIAEEIYKGWTWRERLRFKWRMFLLWLDLIFAKLKRCGR